MESSSIAFRPSYNGVKHEFYRLQSSLKQRNWLESFNGTSSTPPSSSRRSRNWPKGLGSFTKPRVAFQNTVRNWGYISAMESIEAASCSFMFFEATYDFAKSLSPKRRTIIGSVTYACYSSVEVSARRRALIEGLQPEVQQSTVRPSGL